MKKPSKMKRVKAIEIINGETVFNLASTAANDDWIRAGRLFKEGKLDELKTMDETSMYYRPDSMIKKIKKPNSKTLKSN